MLFTVYYGTIDVVPTIKVFFLFVQALKILKFELRNPDYDLKE